MLKIIKFFELYKYLFIGGVNMIFGYGIFSLFIFFGFHYSVAILIATVLGIVFNFYSYGIFFFKNHSNNLIVKFILVYSVLYLINILLLPLVDLLVNNFYLSGAILVLPMAYLGYILNKRFVWKSS